MDKLIGQHLVETKAVRPLVNKNFDPAKYNAGAEGKGNLKRSGNKPKKGKQRVQRKPVAGWLPGGTCDLSVANSVLRVSSTGGDPHLSFSLPEVVKASTMTFTVEMQSKSSGSGQVFWKEVGQPYSAERSQVFDVTHDGNVHTYSIQLSPQGPVQGVRIDPSNGAGQIEIRQMRLLDGNGVPIHEWNFADAGR